MSNVNLMRTRNATPMRTAGFQLVQSITSKYNVKILKLHETPKEAITMKIYLQNFRRIKLDKDFISS